MGKNMRHQEPSNVPLQNGNSNCVNKLLHALNRRHRWQNVRKVLPNKRQGSGKHIIDGGTSEPNANTGQPTNTGQPPEVPKDSKKNKQQNEQASTESSSTSSKSSKKFRIRSLISDEMSKRRGKHQRRRSPSPTRSPKQTSPNRSRHGPESAARMNEKPPTTATQSGCASPSTVKKRKCDICAAMLTVSYLRQKGLANELRKQNIDNNQQSASLQSSGGYLDSHRTGLKKSLSYPLLGTMKRRDFEVEELKRKLRDCKDIETIKEKFILPMDQWKDTILPKPMLTRPASFKNPSPTSRKEKKQPPNNSKTLKQKLGFVVKDSRKEKKRILMDAVFHKIPYGRRSSKDGKKVEPQRLKSSSTNSNANDRPSGGDKARLIRRTSSTTETMNKYRKLLSQTSTRDERCHHNDHKPRLCVVVDHTFIANDRKTIKRIRSLPNISPSDFKHNQEFPVKKMHMDTHPSTTDSALFDDQKSSADHFPFAEQRNVPTTHTTPAPAPAKVSVAKEKNSVDKYAAANQTLGVSKNTSDLQEKIDHQKEFTAAKETGVIDKDETVETNLGEDLNTSDKPKNNEHEIESSACASAADDTTTKETNLVESTIDENLGVGLNTSDHQEIVVEDDENESSAAIETTATETESVDKDEAVDENPRGDLNASDHQESDDKESYATTISPPKVSSEEEDKSFNEILGMFKKVSDQRLKADQEKEPSVVVVRKTAKDKAKDKDQGVDKNQEADQNTLNDHQEEDKSPLASGSEVECSMQEPVPDSSSLTDIHSLTEIPNSPLEDLSDENHQHLFSIHDQPSIDDKQPNNNQPMNLSAADDRLVEKEFLHLDLESLKDNAEFQYVKEVLERSGFLENELLRDWYSSYQPIDPVLFEEVETNFLQIKNLEDLNSLKDEETVQKIISNQHTLLFDLINEALLEIHNRTFIYCPHPLTICSKVRPTPVGRRVLEEVWDFVNMYLSLNPELQPSLDDIVSRDLAKGDGWMNLQADAECVGIELEEMLADDLLDELVFDDLLM